MPRSHYHLCSAIYCRERQINIVVEYAKRVDNSKLSQNQHTLRHRDTAVAQSASYRVKAEVFYTCPPPLSLSLRLSRIQYMSYIISRICIFIKFSRYQNKKLFKHYEHKEERKKIYQINKYNSYKLSNLNNKCIN